MEIRIGHSKKFIIERTGFVKVFLLIFFAVGVTGTAIELSRDLFISLTPLALLLCLAVLILYHRSDAPWKDAMIFGTILFAGFLVETAGVNTGKIFGNYAYGDGLGIKLFETPLLIGANWVVLTYTTSIITDRLSATWYIRIPVASALMVLYDLVMEQVAPLMSMWSFEDAIPVRNYLAWFVIGLTFQTVIKIAGLNFSNRIAPFIFAVQGIFFLILFFIFRFTS